LERALAMDRNLAERDFVAETQALARVAALPRTRDGYLSVSRDRTAPHQAYAHLWSSKAAVTRILQDRHAAARLAHSKSLQASADWQSRVLLRGQLTYWLHNTGKNLTQRDREVRKLHERKEELERRLVKALPELPRRKQLDKLGAAELLARLPADAA